MASGSSYVRERVLREDFLMVTGLGVRDVSAVEIVEVEMEVGAGVAVDGMSRLIGRVGVCACFTGVETPEAETFDVSGSLGPLLKGLNDHEDVNLDIKDGREGVLPLDLRSGVTLAEAAEEIDRLERVDRAERIDDCAGEVLNPELDEKFTESRLLSLSEAISSKSLIISLPPILGLSAIGGILDEALEFRCEAAGLFSDVLLIDDATKVLEVEAVPPDEPRLAIDDLCSLTSRFTAKISESNLSASILA